MASEQHPRSGESLTSTFKVEHSDLASVVSPDPNDKHPAVLATTRVAAFMEITEARMIVPYLKPGQLSVGVTVDIMHSRPTPPGETVEVLGLTSIALSVQH